MYFINLTFGICILSRLIHSVKMATRSRIKNVPPPANQNFNRPQVKKSQYFIDINIINIIIRIIIDKYNDFQML